mgnify:CR=1 FL=1
MANTMDLPAGFVAGGNAAHGFVEGDWFYEEGNQATRLGIKLKEKLHEEQSEYQKLTVFDTEFFGKILTLDDVMMLTERDEFVYHEMLIHIPLLSIENPKTVLIIGGGDAGCLREALKYPSVEKVVQCDIDERVTRVSEEYFSWVKSAIGDPRAEVIFEDGVKYIEEHKNAFDLIVVDSTDPVGCAVGLFLRDFYGKVSEALKPGGVMVAQTESPHWEPKMTGAIYSEIRQVFDFVRPYLGTIPTYPSGCWSWAYASRTRQPTDFFNRELASEIETTTRYYNSDLQTASFALPNFVKRAIDG